MTEQFDRTNTGIIGKNDRKELDTHADIKGTANIEGREYWVDGWRKQRNDGSGSFYSLKFKAKDAQAPAPKAKPSRVPGEDDEPF